MSLLAPRCGDTCLNTEGRIRACALDSGHDGPHEDIHSDQWEPQGVVLERLRKRWGHTHRIAWTGRLWMATAHDRNVSWRTEIEHTPEQLEERLRTRGAYPPVPTPRSQR